MWTIPPFKKHKFELTLWKSTPRNSSCLILIKNANHMWHSYAICLFAVGIVLQEKCRWWDINFVLYSLQNLLIHSYRFTVSHKRYSLQYLCTSSYVWRWSSLLLAPYCLIKLCMAFPVYGDEICFMIYAVQTCF